MSKHRYDPVDMVLTLQQPGDASTEEPPPPAATRAPSGARSDETDRSERDEPNPARDRPVTARVQMNLNVAPATKKRLRELWKPIAADHSQGEIIDLLVERWGGDAAAMLAARSER